MSFEAKVILKLLARQIAMAETPKEAYNAIADAASVEGMQLPTYEEYRKQIILRK